MLRITLQMPLAVHLLLINRQSERHFEKVVFLQILIYASSFVEQSSDGGYVQRWKDIDMIKKEAFVRVLIFIEVFRGKWKLWRFVERWIRSSPAESCSEFKLLMKFLCFNEKSTRQNRKKNDKLAAVRILWYLFVSFVEKNNYQPAPYCAIDEQLLGFRGRCPFRM